MASTSEAPTPATAAAAATSASAAANAAKRATLRSCKHGVLSSTFRLNVSAFCSKGVAFRVVQGMFRRC